MLRRTVLTCCALAFTLPAARADDTAAELKKLQGEWQAVEAKMKGQQVPEGEVKSLRFIIKDDSVTIPAPDGSGRDRKKTLTLKPAALPKQIDLLSLDGQEKGQTAAGIYKLDGNKLTLCMPYFKDPSQRPGEFASGADDGRMLVVLERVVKK